MDRRDSSCPTLGTTFSVLNVLVSNSICSHWTIQLCQPSYMHSGVFFWGQEILAHSQQRTFAFFGQVSQHDIVRSAIAILKLNSNIDYKVTLVLQRQTCSPYHLMIKNAYLCLTLLENAVKAKWQVGCWWQVSLHFTRRKRFSKRIWLILVTEFSA